MAKVAEKIMLVEKLEQLKDIFAQMERALAEAKVIGPFDWTPTAAQAAGQRFFAIALRSEKERLLLDEIE